MPGACGGGDWGRTPVCRPEAAPLTLGDRAGALLSSSCGGELVALLGMSPRCPWPSSGAQPPGASTPTGSSLEPCGARQTQRHRPSVFPREAWAALPWGVSFRLCRVLPRELWLQIPLVFGSLASAHPPPCRAVKITPSRSPLLDGVPAQMAASCPGFLQLLCERGGGQRRVAWSPGQPPPGELGLLFSSRVFGRFGSRPRS